MNETTIKQENVKTRTNLIIGFVLLLVSIQAQQITHTVTQLADGTNQIHYYDENGHLLNSWLYLGDMDDYEFDTFEPFQQGDSPENFGTEYLDKTLWLPDENGG